MNNQRTKREKTMGGGSGKRNRFRLITISLVAIVLLTLCIRQSAQALPGDLDTGFGSLGFVTTDFVADGLQFSEAADIAIQADRKIVVTGNARTSGVNFTQTSLVLVRFNSNGSLDTAFGTGGKVLTDFGLGFNTGSAIGIQADGKIVVAGLAAASSGAVAKFIALARYNQDGSLDSTFGSGGKVTSSFDVDSVSDMAIQSDGRILVAGSANTDFLLARFFSNGSLDIPFGVPPGVIGLGGAVTTDFGGSDIASAVTIQVDGNILVVGSSEAGGDSVFALARYASNGLLDSTFGSNARVTTNFVSDDHGGSTGDAALGVAIQNDGKIVVVGRTETDTGLARVDFALARYNSNGSLDTTFGSGGKIITAFVPGDPQRANDSAFDVAVQPDGSIVAAGFSGVPFSEVFAVARYDRNGTLDTTFGGDGKVTTDRRAFLARAIAIQKNDGRIVLAGQGSGVTLARFHAFQCGGRNVTILGTGGADNLVGATSFDPIAFRLIPANDVIHGLGGSDTINGGGGDDTICGGAGNDSINGGLGNDSLFGDAGIDALDGGVGTDTCVDRGIFNSFSGCEGINSGFSGISGAWDTVSQRCDNTAGGLTCRVKGTIAVENPGTESTAVPFVAAFYLSSDNNWDENDTFLGTRKLRALGGGKTRKVRFGAKLDEEQNPSGKFLIGVLDVFNAVPERKEKNNVVVSPALP